MTPDEERKAALDSYRSKLIESREWEAKLKNLRLEIKDLQKEFDRTEDNIKALQSVGQIIGEVLKQLDDERCTRRSTEFSQASFSSIGQKNQELLTSRCYSHREGIVWTEIRRWLQIQGGQGEVEAGYTRGTRHDYSYYHAYAASRSRSSRLQHVAGRPRSSQLRRHWWFE